MFGHGDVGFFDRIAPLYDAAMPPAHAEDLRAGLAFAHRPIERVVDLGGGTGRASRTLRDLGIDATVVDYSAGMLRRARDDGLAAVRADAATLPVRDAGVDAVVVTDALHHFPDPEAAVREVARTLAPGGVLVVREFDPSTRRGRALAALESVAGMDSRFFAADALAAVFDDAGLRGHVVDPGFGYTAAGVKPSA
ncbi:class I SAM-dependent methyltransferase [Halobaculum gomorrense]|uniref:Demethylmenaquinone methyltransferase / 2-methoxy-6-polyprenyl-1,4-benzoquinol methylase n=1 Tax=Halobaculum gomorrense TaxID=43928 RepID=A0A1M5U254_9EURY|nr:class I SAM-dependent methyltransferase [Halobaculum gomorrense]SHH57175.1 demethylmenaquinone methyltransferase / 2-methoxy-6-polyprenyl-1,4-benzoquinol methylase [Halobaculum gomorrense]